MFWQVLYHYRNRPIWAVGRICKLFQCSWNNLVQCLNKNSKWSKLFDILGIISAILDMVGTRVLKSYREDWCCPLNDFVIFTFKKKGGGEIFFSTFFSNLGVSNMDLPVCNYDFLWKILMDHHVVVHFFPFKTCRKY